ncbi:MAG: hypothetical protein ACRD2P_06375 [Terriglobia bacterium]
MRQPLSNALECKDFFLYGGREVHKHKVAFVVEVIFSTFIDDPNQIILGCSQVGENPVDFAAYE